MSNSEYLETRALVAIWCARLDTAKQALTNNAGGAGPAALRLLTLSISEMQSWLAVGEPISASPAGNPPLKESVNDVVGMDGREAYAGRVRRRGPEQDSVHNVPSAQEGQFKQLSSAKRSAAAAFKKGKRAKRTKRGSRSRR